MSAPTITASLMQNNMDVTIPVLVTNNVVPILDNFNRANSATTLNPASDGGTWAVDFGGVFGITGNTAYNISAVVGVGPSSGPNVAIARRDVGQAVMEFVVDITRSSTAGGSVLVACYDPITTFCYEVIYDSSSSFGSLNRIASDGHPGLGVSVFFNAWTGSTTSLKLSRDAAGVVTISQLVSGSWVSKGTFTDTFPLTGTWAGFGTAPTSPGADNWDNFTVTPPSGSTGPYTYTIDYDDGITDSFTTTLSTHTFTHTYLNTTPKIIKVQAYSGVLSSIIDSFTGSDGTVINSRPLNDGITNWTSKENFFSDAIISGNRATTSQEQMATIPVGSSGAVQVDYDISSSGFSANAGVCWNATLGLSSFYYSAAESNGLDFVVGNQAGLIVNEGVNAPTGTIRLEWDGTNVTVKFNGVTKYTDPQSVTNAGVYIAHGGFVDNFSYTTQVLYSNIVLLYPVWVTGSAANNSTRTAFI